MGVDFQIPHKLLPFVTERAPFKITHGGRGSAKSHTIARILVVRAYTERHKILCCREFQNSISDSVHALLKTVIEQMGLAPWFKITDTSIVCWVTGSEFIFKGLKRNINEIKSLEGVTLTWVEEAQSVSEYSWLILIPTVFRTGAEPEMFVSFNPMDAEDPTYKRFVLAPPPGAMVIPMNWRDNPWFSRRMDDQRRAMLNDPDAYDWVWEGHVRKMSSATIFRNRFRVESFETPERVERFWFGADWGFATDPTALLRGFFDPDERNIYVDHEAYGWGTELDDIPALFAGGRSNKTGEEFPGIPEARRWPIKGDGARPETISYVRRQDFNISAAEKWQGSVEDGIEWLKSFNCIYIHERCKNFAAEARLYSYKVDERTQDVLPEIVDKHNHGWDALRYAFDGLITRTGAAGAWSRLARDRP